MKWIIEKLELGARFLSVYFSGLANRLYFARLTPEERERFISHQRVWIDAFQSTTSVLKTGKDAA